MNFVPQNDLLCEARKSSEVRILNKLKMDDMKNESNHKKQNKGGRIPKTNPSIHRHVFRLNEE